MYRRKIKEEGREKRTETPETFRLHGYWEVESLGLEINLNYNAGILSSLQ